MTRNYQELRDQMSPEQRAAVDARVASTLAEMAQADPVILEREALEDLRDNLAQLRDRVLSNEGRPSADVIAARLTFMVTQFNAWLAADPLLRGARPTGNGPLLSDDVPPVDGELPPQVLPPPGE